MGDTAIACLDQQEDLASPQQGDSREAKDKIVTGARKDMREAREVAVENGRGSALLRPGAEVPSQNTNVAAVRCDVMALPQRAAGAMMLVKKAQALTTAPVECTVSGLLSDMLYSPKLGFSAVSDEQTDIHSGDGEGNVKKQLNVRRNGENGFATTSALNDHICRSNAYGDDNKDSRSNGYVSSHQQIEGVGCGDDSDGALNVASPYSFSLPSLPQVSPRVDGDGNSSNFSRSGNGTILTGNTSVKNYGDVKVPVHSPDILSSEASKHEEFLEQRSRLQHKATDIITGRGHKGDSYLPAASPTCMETGFSSGQREPASGVAATARQDARISPKKQTTLTGGRPGEAGSKYLKHSPPVLLVAEMTVPPRMHTDSATPTDDAEEATGPLGLDTHIFGEANEETLLMNSLTAFPIYAPSAAPLSPWLTSAVEASANSRPFSSSAAPFPRRPTVPRSSGCGGQQSPLRFNRIVSPEVCSSTEDSSQGSNSDSIHQRDAEGQQSPPRRMSLSPLFTLQDDNSQQHEDHCSLGSASPTADSLNRSLDGNETRFRENPFALGDSRGRTFVGDTDVVYGSPVMVSLREESTYDLSEAECANVGEGVSDGKEIEGGEQWLQIPVLFYLVFNLIKLHEAGEYRTQRERERELSEIIDDSSTPLAARRSSVTLSASLQDVYTQLSHTLLEVSGVLLQPRLTVWSDAILREAVAEVVEGWKKGGPHSQEFESASFRLLRVVSADRCGKVRPTVLYRVWEFIGAREHCRHVIIGIFITVFVLLASLLSIACLGGDQTVARVTLVAWTCIIVLFSAGVCLVLVDHNAVAEEVRDFHFSQLLSRVAVAMRDVDGNCDEDTNPNAQDTSFMGFGAQGSRFHESGWYFGGLGVKGNGMDEDAFGAHNGIRSLGTASSRGGQGSSNRHTFMVSTAVGTSRPEIRVVHSFQGSMGKEEDRVLRNEAHGDGSAWVGKWEWGGGIRHPKPHECRDPNEGDPQLEERLYDIPAFSPEEAMLKEDRYNSVLLSRVNYEQTQLAEEQMKEKLLKNRLGVGSQDSQRPNVEDAVRSPALSDVAMAALPGGIHESSSGGSYGFVSLPANSIDSVSGGGGGGGSNGRVSPKSRPLVPVPTRMTRDNLVNSGLDALSITALVYCRDHTVTEDIFTKLWNRNFLILQRKSLEALDAAFHRGSERFKVFLLHAPDLDAEQLQLALSWLRQERRSVFFFASALGTMAQEVPYAFRLELPLTTRDLENLLLSGVGVDEEMNNACIFRTSKKFKVPPYTLGRRLGCGAYSNVFEVEMELTGAHCAVKRIYLRGDREEEENEADSQLKEIAREVGIMSSLSHPNIVQYLFCERDDNCVSIFMELCSGGSLSELIASGGLQHADEIKRALRDVISAVAYLHGKHIVHRDLKPENVLFRLGRAKVSDFGTAVFKRGGLTNVKGTFAYMAPEVLLGETYGKACDVWSIGCIAADALSVPLGHRSLGLPELCDHYRRMSLDETLEFDCDEPTVREFLQLCLRRDPKKRSSVEELLAHPMLREEDDTAVQQWLTMSAERRRAQQLEELTESSNFTRAKIRTRSTSTISLRSADLLGAHYTPYETPLSPPLF
ncbi:protein kinase, putative [Trypanosoma cruzi marinkellei]|uniref:Protein kinase, putative n=1 Tax=Trypanosoma cruzi marinkellei TaxID=85056 RepID=K2NB89_TRYCR|nr:protein kinase, putative [Trypanosoma cruzi marinkellei]